MNEVEVERVKEFEQKFLAYLKLKEKKLLTEIASTKLLEEKVVKGLEKATKEFVNTFKRGAKK